MAQRVAVAVVVVMTVTCTAHASAQSETIEREVLAGVLIWKDNSSPQAASEDTAVQPSVGFGGVRWIHNHLGISGLFSFVGSEEVFFMVGAQTRIVIAENKTLRFGMSYVPGGAVAPEVLLGYKLSERYHFKVGVTWMVGCGVEGACPVLYPTARLTF